jgi:hypothetical protein
MLYDELEDIPLDEAPETYVATEDAVVSVGTTDVPYMSPAAEEAAFEVTVEPAAPEVAYTLEVIPVPSLGKALPA